jgi:hypothetical protein
VDLLALVVAVVALAAALVALRRSVRRPTPQPPRAQPQTATATGTPPPAELSVGLTTALRHVSVVRYDAFSDVTGRQSFTAAILDDNGDGIVITSLHSRTESRTLLKGIVAARGDGLSPEEQQAVDYANGSKEQPGR